GAMDRTQQIRQCVSYYIQMRKQLDTMLIGLLTLFLHLKKESSGRHLFESRTNTMPLRRDVLDRIIGEGNDMNCIWELGMSV
ncbi:hypothetical protein PIB30_109353, partial [Stylosanthes scabra]|nr:hypothetical protein [Stylosanthes scabra]